MGGRLRTGEDAARLGIFGAPTFVVGEELCRWARSAKLVRCWRRSFWVTLALPIALGALFIARASTGRDELLFAVLPIGLYWTTEVGFALTTTKRLFSADLVRSRSGTNRNS